MRAHASVYAHVCMCKCVNVCNGADMSPYIREYHFFGTSIRSCDYIPEPILVLFQACCTCISLSTIVSLGTHWTAALSELGTCSSMHTPFLPRSMDRRHKGLPAFSASLWISSPF